MRRITTGGRLPRTQGKDLKSVACILFVLALGVGFWSGAVWIGEALLRLSAGG